MIAADDTTPYMRLEARRESPSRRSGRRARLSALLALALVVGACIRRPEPEPITPADVPALRGGEGLLAAQQAADSGRWAEAERRLASLARETRGSAIATEVMYWRALYRLDPANPAYNPAMAAQLLTTYLSAPQLIQHAADARTLRRIATALDSLGARIPATPDDAAKAKAQEEEMEKLKTELEKANEELERIRRRLGAPRPVAPGTPPGTPPVTPP